MDLIGLKARSGGRGETPLSLGLQLLISALMVPVLALTHGLGLMGMSRFFNLTDEALLHKTLSVRSIFLVAFVASLLFALHAIETSQHFGPAVGNDGVDRLGKQHHLAGRVVAEKDGGRASRHLIVLPLSLP